MLLRRQMLALGGALLAAPCLAAPQAAAADPRLAPRALGKADAPVTVTEYFSLTCTHCAAWAGQVFPRVRSELIETGKLRYVLADYPLDQVALLAAMVARSLPPDRYEPFVLALLATQDRWAFNHDNNPTEEIAKMAALAGMNRTTFDAVGRDAALKAAIVADQAAATKRYGIDSTPTFLFSGAHAQNSKHAGEMSFDEFAHAVAEAG